MASMAPPTPASVGRTVWIRRISKTILNAAPGAESGGAHKQIAAAVAAAGWAPLTNLAVSWRHRSALLEFATTAEASAFVAAFTPPAPPLMLDGFRVEVIAAEVAYDPEKPCADEDALARAGARDCVAAMLRKLGNEEAEQNRLNRVERRRVQRALIRDQIAAATSSVRDDVCWNFVKRGKCRRGTTCSYAHDVAATIADIPVKMRHFVERESFPVAREGHAEKCAVNAAVVSEALSVGNKRCIVLDGPGCESARALCATGDREAVDIVVPNACTETYIAIRDSGLCLAYHGSLRAFIEDNARAPPRQPRVGEANCDADRGDGHACSNLNDGDDGDDYSIAPNTALETVCGDLNAGLATENGTSAVAAQGTSNSDANKAWHPATRETYGVAYLDYCSSLYAGRGTDVERSPLGDIEALFARGTLDPHGAVLAITVAIADDGPSVECINADLIAHVSSHAASVGFTATPTLEFRFDSTLVRFFKCISEKEYNSSRPIITSLT